MITMGKALGSTPSTLCPVKSNINRNMIVEKKAEGSCLLGVKVYPSASIVPESTIRTVATGDLERDISSREAPSLILSTYAGQLTITCYSSPMRMICLHQYLRSCLPMCT